MRKDYEGEKQGKKVDKNEGNRHLYLTVNLGQDKKTRGKSSTLLFFVCLWMPTEVTVFALSPIFVSKYLS